MADRTVKVRLLADYAAFKTGMAQASGAVKQFGGDSERALAKHEQLAKGMSTAGAAMTSAGKKMSIGLTAPLLAFAKVAESAATDTEESLNKVREVFRDNAGEIDRWAQSAATNLGISRQQALEAAGTFGNLFSAMRIGLPAATDMSQELVQLASDLASFNNADPTDVLTALRSGLVGEVEPLRRFGVSLSAARVEDEALRLGLVKTKDKVDAAAKAQAAYSIILADTSLAQGDFARTAEGNANAARITRAEFEDMKAELGEGLIPVMGKLLDMGRGVVGFFNDLSPAGQDAALAVGGVLAVAGPATTAIGGVLRIGGGVINAYDRIGTSAGVMADKFRTARSAGMGVTGALGSMKGALGAAGLAAAIYTYTRAAGWAADETDRLRSTLSDMVAAGSGPQAEINAIYEALNAMRDTLVGINAEGDSDFFVAASDFFKTGLGGQPGAARAADALRASIDELKMSMPGAVDQLLGMAEAEGLIERAADGAVYALGPSGVRGELVYTATQATALRDAAKAAAEGLDATGEAGARAAEGTERAGGGAEKAAQRMEKATQRMETFRDAVAGTLSGFVDPLRAYQDEVEQVATATADSTKKQSDSWADYADSAEVSLRDVMDRMKEESQARRDWSTNMLILSTRMSDRTLQVLADMGPEGAQLVGDLVDASDKQLRRFEGLAVQSTEAGTAGMISKLQAAGPVLESVAESHGQRTADGLARKLAEGTTTIRKIAAGYGVELAGGLNPIIRKDQP